MRSNNKTITFNIAKKAIQFILKKPGKEKDIIFTGGEPLLKKELLKKLILYSNYYAKKNNKKLFVGIATNGSLLKKSDVLFFNKFQNIQLSISVDGIKEINDLNRIQPGKKSTFESLEKKFELFKKLNDFKLRLTVTPETVKKLMENILFFEKKGFKIIDFQTSKGFYWNKKEVDSYKNQLKKICEYYEENKNIKIPWIDNEIKYKNKKIIDKCPMLKKEIAIDTEGNIYPCQFFLALKKREDYKVGSIFTGFNSNIKKFQNFKLNVNHTKIKNKNNSALFRFCNQYDIKKNELNSSKIVFSNYLIEETINEVIK